VARSRTSEDLLNQTADNGLDQFDIEHNLVERRS
jgi:3-polyprenyl-4-hydroxybenzoate decarboxylase